MAETCQGSRIFFAKELTMKRILLAAIALTLSASLAMAGGYKPKPDPAARAEARASAHAAQRQGQNQGQSQGQQQANLQGQGQGQAINNNQVYNEAVQAPSVSVANACGIGGSFGSSGTMSGVYVPLSVGITWESRPCVVAREAQMLYNFGDVAAARAHMGHIKRVKKTYEAMAGG
jgi:hypothetical protein